MFVIPPAAERLCGWWCIFVGDAGFFDPACGGNGGSSGIVFCRVGSTG